MGPFGPPKESRKFCRPGAGNLGTIVLIGPIPSPQSPNPHAGESLLRARLPQMAAGCPGPHCSADSAGRPCCLDLVCVTCVPPAVECEAQFRTPHQAKRRTIHPNLTHLVFLPHSHPPPLSLGPFAHCCLPLLSLYPSQYLPTLSNTTGELIHDASRTTLTSSHQYEHIIQRWFGFGSPGPLRRHLERPCHPASVSAELRAAVVDDVPRSRKARSRDRRRRRDV